MIITDPQKIDELLTRGVNEVIDYEHLRTRLLSGEKLRIKLGIDPTSPNIHIGRSVLLLKLRDFQELGHTAVFIVGDETGRIGDTSDKDSERPMLSAEVVEENMKNYLNQAYLLLDKDKTETHHNSEWLSKLRLMELAQMANLFSLKEFSAREVIARRLAAGQRVSFHEMLYPIYQGYDSVAVKADVELGGTDQRFNLLAGRQIQPLYKQEPQDILMANLILGIDGRKMSSSWGNTINVTDAPNDMFGKTMSIPDDQIITYLEHCTRVPMSEVKKLQSELESGANPRDAKLFLATALVSLYHSEAAALEAKEYFINTFSKGEVPADIREEKVLWEEALDGYENLNSFLFRTGLAKSKSDAGRKAEQGGVTLEGVKLESGLRIFNPETDAGKVLKVGKKDFVRLTF